MPSSLAATSQSFRFDHSAARSELEPMAVTVSKLKDMPFHSMNSPLCTPASKRRPSGIHLTTVTGFFDLPRDVCRCRVGIDSAGLSRRETGGKTSMT